MFKVPIRFVLVKSSEILEVKLDKRLSFEDNFKIIKKLIKTNYDNIYVFDPIRKIFLRRDLPLFNFEIETFRMFYLFTCWRRFDLF